MKIEDQKEVSSVRAEARIVPQIHQDIVSVEVGNVSVQRGPLADLGLEAQPRILQAVINGDGASLIPPVPTRTTYASVGSSTVPAVSVLGPQATSRADLMTEKIRAQFRNKVAAVRG